MRKGGPLSFVSKLGALVIAAGAVLAPATASAQYTVQVLGPPADLPADTTTRSVAVNRSGQAFGEAIVTPSDRRPLMWIGGAAQNLSLPAGTFWDDSPAHEFLNDAGTAVGQVAIPGGVPGFPNLNQSRIVVWHSGAAAGQLAPLPPITVCAADYGLAYGLNSSGHILMLSGDMAGSCHALWLWDGQGSAPSNFQFIADMNGGATACTPTFSIRTGSSHLNDADHVGLDFGPRDGPSVTCPTPFTSGVFSGGSYTPKVTLTPTLVGGVLAINNQDQLLFFTNDGGSSTFKLWNGTSVVDFGVGGGYFNNFGHVLMVQGAGGNPPVRLYKNGTTTDVPVPQQIPGFEVQPSAGIGIGGITDTGHLLLGMFFGPALGPVKEHPVLLSPAPPTLTQKVNGLRPNPPAVTTTGPMALTLDISASAYTGNVSWYWALIVNNQVLWVTPTGFAATPAPLLVAPPVAVTNASLLNVTLPPATTVASLFILVDGQGSPVAIDLVAAIRQ